MLKEENHPNYYVKIDRFFPVFPLPYDFYRDAPLYLRAQAANGGDSLSFDNRVLPSVTIRSRRGGLRKLDRSKPAVVMDAYEAFNLAADYGLNAGTHDYRTFSQQMAVATVGDMGMDRRYFIQEQYDGKPLNMKANEAIRDEVIRDPYGNFILEQVKNFSMPKVALRKYKQLRYLDKIYIYTDYAPREQGSPNYQGSNQPDVVIDYRLFPDDGYQPSYRERHYILDGYAVCEDFYSPDYSQKPLPDTKDYRRTLYWTPKVEFDANGKATVNLYNNSKQTVLSVHAEGITATGTPIVWDNGN